MFCLLLLRLRQRRQPRDRAWRRAREGIRDSTGARGPREPRQAAVDRGKPVERDRHDGHRRLAHGVVGGRGRVNAPAGVPRMHEVAINARVVSFAAVLALLVTAVGNAVPTFRASRTPIAGALKDGAAVSGRTSGRLRAGLVVAEIAAAVMLLVGAGLLVANICGVTTG